MNVHVQCRTPFIIGIQKFARNVHKIQLFRIRSMYVLQPALWL
jgi:hypothetical protein